MDLLEQQLQLQQHRNQPATLATSWITLRTILHRYMLMFKHRWWVVFATISIGLAVAAWYGSQLPPSYISEARMMVSGKINLQDGAVYTEEFSNFFGTQMELMQSGEVQKRAIARMRTLHPELPSVPVRL